jgi:hypothetical protein
LQFNESEEDRMQTMEKLYEKGIENTEVAEA